MCPLPKILWRPCNSKDFSWIDFFSTSARSFTSIKHTYKTTICSLTFYYLSYVRWNVSSSIVPISPNTINKTQSIYYSTKKPSEFSVTVKDNIRTTCLSHFQVSSIKLWIFATETAVFKDVRLIKFQTNGEFYSPGDVLVLRPKNLPSQVEAFKDVLLSNGVEMLSQTRIKLSECSGNMPVPAVLQNEVNFHQLCEEYFDLTAIPRRYTFSVLSQLTDSALEKEKCLEFTSAEGQDELYSYVNRPRRNIVEVLGDFPNATKNLTWEMLFEILPPIKPREFSIASSYKHTNNEVHILVAVVKYKTKLVAERLGLCSNYLADLKNGDPISVWLKNGSFKFPQVSQKSIFNACKAVSTLFPCLFIAVSS